MTTDEMNRLDQPIAGVRRSARVITQTNSYTTIMEGNLYAYTDETMSEEEVLPPDGHVFFNHGAFQNELDGTAVIMARILLKPCLKKWGKKGRGAFHSDMNLIHTKDTFVPIHRKEFT